MIFMNFFARSSRATGPKIRVPIGSSSLLIKTAELPSNLMKLPSGRPTSRAVRTITALATSPFFTFALGSASLREKWRVRELHQQLPSLEDVFVELAASDAPPKNS